MCVILAVLSGKMKLGELDLFILMEIFMTVQTFAVAGSAGENMFSCNTEHSYSREKSRSSLYCPLIHFPIVALSPSQLNQGIASFPFALIQTRIMDFFLWFSEKYKS